MLERFSTHRHSHSSPEFAEVFFVVDMAMK
jgi:hypothetical protein